MLRGRVSLFDAVLALEMHQPDQIKVRTLNYLMHHPRAHGQELESFQVLDSYLNFRNGRWDGNLWVLYATRGSAELREGPIHDLITETVAGWERKRKARSTLAEEALQNQEQALHHMQERLAECERATPQALNAAAQAAEAAEPRIEQITMLMRELEQELEELQGRHHHLAQLRGSAELVDYFRSRVRTHADDVAKARERLRLIQSEGGLTTAVTAAPVAVVAGIGLAELD